MQHYFSDFLMPSIDSFRLRGSYRLSQFMDETIHAVTLSYERALPISSYPEWLSWNVYIHPENGKVNKVFLVKQTDSTHQQQLTWRCEKGCLIRTFERDSTGSLHLLEEKEYSWE